MELVAVDNTASLRRLWPEIVGDLRAVKAKCQEDWFVEDIWTALVNQRAVLGLINDAGKRRGFIVWEFVFDPFSIAPVLNVWVAVGLGMLPDFDWAVAQMDAVALRGGATKVRMTSPRKGWDRSGFDKYFTPARTVWERNL